MRAIKIDLPGRISVSTGEAAGSDFSREVYDHLARYELELCHAIAQRAKAYFPADYRVFACFRPKPEAFEITTEIWVLDPTVRWRGTFFARRAWRLLLPVISGAATSVFAENLQQVAVAIDAEKSGVTVYSPTRGWLDPALVAVGAVVLTSWYWLAGHAAVVRIMRGWIG